MDEHQRRVIGSMLRELDAYEAGSIPLARLVTNLQGLLGAADFKDTGLINEFWNQEVPIDAELELRTEGWAPPGAASDEDLVKALASFRSWVERLLSSPSIDRV